MGEEALTRRTLATAAAAATGVQVGSAMVATRFVVDQTGPASLALLRYSIGFLCLLPLALAAPRPKFAVRDLMPIALLGITQFGILIALLNYGLRFIPAARAAVIFATLPLLTPMNSTAPQPARVRLGHSAKNPSPAASAARNATEASIASALTGTVGYRRTYGR